MADIVNNIVKSSASNLHTTIQNYCDGRLLRNIERKLVYYTHGQKRNLPKNQGKVVEFWKMTPLAPLTSALVEGEIPAAQSYGQTKTTAAISSYGGYIATSDVLLNTAAVDAINHVVDLVSDQAQLSVDTVTRDAMLGGTNVLYSGGKSARNAVTATDNLTVLDIRRGVRVLEKNGAPKFMRNGKGFYKAIIGPDAKYALMSDSLWQDVSKYQQAEKIENGEIGKLFGVIFIETDNNKIYEAAGASGADVDTVMLFGSDAYGVVNLGTMENAATIGSNAKIIIKDTGSAGTADPLNMVKTFGWKVEGFTTKILNGDWLLRIESAVKE